jgi:predicted transcriptional regulator
MSDFVELDLWGPPPATADPNSQAAAESMVLSAGNLRRAVMQVIARWGPIAEWEIEAHLGMSGNTTRPRVWELHRGGLIERTPHKGLTPSGRACWMYVATAEGRRALG